MGCFFLLAGASAGRYDHHAPRGVSIAPRRDQLCSKEVGKCTQPAKPDQPPAGPKLRLEGNLPAGPYISPAGFPAGGRRLKGGPPGRRGPPAHFELGFSGLKPILRASPGPNKTPR